MKRRVVFFSVILPVVWLSGCAASRLHHEGVALIKQDRTEEGLAKLALAVEAAPTNPVYRSDYLLQRDMQLEKLLAQGKARREAEDWQGAKAALERANQIAPLDPRPQDALTDLARARGFAADLDQARADIRHGDLDRARQVVSSVLSLDPRNKTANTLRGQIDDIRAKDSVDSPVLQTAPGKAVSLHFTDASVRMILEAIARSSALTIMIDQDIRPDLLTSLTVDHVSARDAINFVMQMNHLRSKVLDAN